MYGKSPFSHLIDVFCTAAHNSYTSLDSDFVGPQSKRPCGLIIFRDIYKFSPSIDFGRLNFKLFWVTRTKI